MNDVLLDEIDGDEDGPWTVAVCPISPELAAQIVEMTGLDWEDPDVTGPAMVAAGWNYGGGYLGDLGELAYTPAGHLVYGDDCMAMPFEYRYYIHPDGVWSEDFWAEQDGWQILADAPVGTFDAQLETVVTAFTELLGPPDHDVTHRRRPQLPYEWRYRAWRRGDNVLIVAPGMDPHSYSQFEHALVQIRHLPAVAPFPAATELPDFCWH